MVIGAPNLNESPRKLLHEAVRDTLPLLSFQTTSGRHPYIPTERELLLHVLHNQLVIMQTLETLAMS